MAAGPGQVASLGSGVWWGGDADYLGAWQARQGTAGTAAVATAIELLHLLQHLPVLERLCPLPGAAHAGSSPTHGDADERILGKIRALLAKAESTEFPEEAEALSARAQGTDGQVQHRPGRARGAEGAPGLTGRAAAAGGQPVRVTEGITAADDREGQPLPHCLAQATRHVHGGRLPGRRGRGGAAVHFAAGAGERRDAASGRETGRLRAVADQGVPPVIPYRVRDPHRGTVVAGHSAREQKAAAASSGQGLLPVLRARQQAVDDAVGEMFGDTLTSGRAMRATDAEGWYSGRAAADMATLHNHSQVTA